MVINDFSMHLIQNGLEYKNADRRGKQWYKDIEAKEETVKESVVINLTT